MPDDLTISIDEGPISEVIEGPSQDVTDISDPIIGIAVENPATEEVPSAPPVESVTIVEKGDPGPPGPPGPPGGGGGGGTTDYDTTEIVAHEAIPALSFVTSDGKIADSNNPFHFNKVMGITLVSVPVDTVATVITEGEVTDLSWNWTANQKLFLNGTALSPIPVSSGFSQMLAVAQNSQTIFIRVRTPIRL
jgi:hypothetical protein